ncbi:MAG: NAD-dependent epimerase/dehydratase family protein [Planctomycetes bacterium]|nr:NAD-dependent epimerase/dehydratase family protein [Planctomycetota bacterium]
MNALATRGMAESILGLDVRPPTDSPKVFRQITTDVRMPFGDVFQREGVDTAVHLAFSFGPTRNRRTARSVNVEGMRNFLQACLTARVKRAVVLSSATTYGAWRDNPERLIESSPLRAGRGFPYAHDKRICDEMCAAFAAEHPEISLAWCRTPIVLGANVDNYFSRLLFKPKVVYFRGDDPPMQFIHEDDLCNALLTLLECEGRGPYNAAPDDTIRFTELAAEFKRAPAGLPAGMLWAIAALTYWTRWTRLNETPPGALSYIRHRWVIDSEKIRRETGFQCARTSLEAVRAWRRAVVDRVNTGQIPAGKVRL